MIAPLLEEIALEKGKAVKIGKVNVDECQELAFRYKVRAIPTLLFIKGGEVCDQVVRVTGKPDLATRIEALI